MQLVYEKEAIKGLARMQPKIATSIRSRLQEIALSPFARHANVTALSDVDNCFRLRRGDWRAIYELHRGRDEMIVIWVGPRGEAYR